MEQIPIRWPDGLRDRIRAVAGHRGVSQFVIQAVIEKLDRDEGASGVRVPRRPHPPKPLAPGTALTVPKSGRPGAHAFRPQTANRFKCADCGALERRHVT